MTALPSSPAPPFSSKKTSSFFNVQQTTPSSLKPLPHSPLLPLSEMKSSAFPKRSKLMECLWSPLDHLSLPIQSPQPLLWKFLRSSIGISKRSCVENKPSTYGSGKPKLLESILFQPLYIFRTPFLVTTLANFKERQHQFSTACARITK